LNKIRSIVDALHRFRHLYLVGGPVGLYYTLKLAVIKRRMARLAEYITREKELNRAHLSALNFEVTQLVVQQQATNQAAVQFWNRCEKNAGVQS
jgi:hypothetical protein